MDFETLLALVPALMHSAPVISAAIKNGVSINSIETVIDDPNIRLIFKLLGAQLFPGATPAQATTAAVVTSYDLDYVKKVQNGMNRLLQPSPGLIEDGKYGPATKAAVTKYQDAHGLVIDGWAGVNTMASVKAELAKLGK